MSQQQVLTSQYYKRRIYRSILLSYFLMLLLPLALSVYSYTYSQNMIQEEIQAAQSAYLKNVQLTLDQRIQQVYTVNSLLASNTLIQKVAQSGADPAPAQLFDYAQAQDLLCTETLYLYGTQETILYFSQSRSVLTTDRRYREDMLAGYAAKWKLSEAEFLRLMNGGSYREYAVVFDGSQPAFVMFLNTIYHQYSREPLGKVITILPVRELTAPLDNLLWTKDSIGYVALSAGEILSSGESGLLEGFPGYGGAAPDDAQAGRPAYAFASIPSMVISAKYCVAIPLQSFQRGLLAYRNVIFLSLGFLLLLGTGMAFLFSKSQYKPIRKLMAILNRGKKTAPGQLKGLTYTTVETALNGLITSNQSLRELLNKSNEVRRNAIFNGILKNRIRWDMQLRDAMVAQNMSFMYHECVVVTFAHAEYEQKNDELPVDLVIYTLKSAITEILFKEKFRGMADECDGMITAVAYRSPGTGWDDLEPLLAQILSFYRATFSNGLYALVSVPGTGIGDIPELYQQTLEMLAYKEFWGDEAPDILYFSKIDSEAPKLNNPMLKYGKNLFNALSVRDYERARTILFKQLDESFIKDVRYQQINKCRMFGLINTALAAMGNIQEEDNDFVMQLDPINRLLSVQTVNGLKEETQALFEEMIEHNRSKEQNEIPAWVGEVKAYIRENYPDPTLDVSAVAKKFGMNVSYLSRTFKKCTGTGVLDYIHTVRLGKCKELLSRNVAVARVAQQTGYIDSKALIRTFKRYEGITPGQYRP